MVSVTLLAAFLAGVISFLSPCVLPLVPGFLAYLAGIAPGQEGERWRLFGNSVAYVLGFAAIFSLLGVLLNTVLSNVSAGVQLWLSRVGGAIIILFGLFLLGLLPLPFLEREHALNPKKGRNAYLTSFVFGAAFAVGWTPCVGAVLGGILALAATQPGSSFALLLAYTLGLGIPFLLVGLFSAQALALIRKLGPFLRWFQIIMGVILIVLGILVFTQTLASIASLGFINNLLLSRS
jgi:cytochrome c-type biogenesis protein